MQTTQELPSQAAAGALRAQRQPGGQEGARKHTRGTEGKGAPWKEGQAGMDLVGGLQASAEADEVNEGEIRMWGRKESSSLQRNAKKQTMK